MGAQELIIWSMALGAILAVAVARMADLISRPGLSSAQGVAYHLAVFLLVLIESGVIAQASTVNPRFMHAAQVLAGPVCMGLANFWIRGWLSAAQRDRLMSGFLRASALLLPVFGLACLALPIGQQLPASAALTLLGAVVTLWLTVRASLLGDRLAFMMSAGCLLTVPSIAGLYATAINVPMNGLLVALLASCAALANGITGFVLWRRDRHEWKSRRADTGSSLFDAVTKLDSGVALVQKLIKAQRRRRRTRRDGAVIAVLVFNVESITEQVGTAGVNDMFITLASHFQRQVGVVNPVGRYYEQCFVSLVETIHSPGWLRTLGLRVASSLRRPVEVNAAGGQRVEVLPDIGVGVVHLSPGHLDVEDILHDAQRMAEAARTMRSRAAIMDPATGEVVPVEQANLGPRRHARADLVPHA